MEMNEKQPMQDSWEMKLEFARQNNVDVRMVGLKDNYFFVKPNSEAEESSPSEEIENMKMEIAKEKELDVRRLDWTGAQWLVNLGNEKVTLESYDATHSLNNKDVN